MRRPPVVGFEACHASHSLRDLKQLASRLSLGVQVARCGVELRDGLAGRVAFCPARSRDCGVDWA
eukprot:12200568-Alexandrium_andersonii.AAC.1